MSASSGSEHCGRIPFSSVLSSHDQSRLKHVLVSSHLVEYIVERYASLNMGTCSLSAQASSGGISVQLSKSHDLINGVLSSHSSDP